MYSLQTAILAIADKISILDEVRQMHDYAPDQLGVYPAGIVYPQTGGVDVAPIGARLALHNIAIEIFIPIQTSTSARQMEQLLEIVDLVLLIIPEEISDRGTRFGGTISTYGALNYEYISANYAGVPVRGYRFTMSDVKILETEIIFAQFDNDALIAFDDGSYVTW